jgi:hypothetical protein
MRRSLLLAAALLALGGCDRGRCHESCTEDSDCGAGLRCQTVMCFVGPCPGYCTGACPPRSGPEACAGQACGEPCLACPDGGTGCAAPQEGRCTDGVCTTVPSACPL